ncbi:transketolase [Exiguobacterium sp. PvP048]|uniref:Transketolase n=2 Tax=Bacillales Family XII. Incertae Sedis TaxID=539742 RepID=B1YE75_EXIS2|nr:transketolase [Exiguobacterium sibiricum 255-15]
MIVLTNMTTVELLAVNTIRTLSIDAVQKANSGHPGMPMGAAPMAFTLWADHMNHNPKNPEWFNRDRFVLSAGHGSMLLYSLLHLSGYDLAMDDLKSFRQWNSKTPGHPEYRHTAGVDATTGPLGQGIAMAVGMAMAERHLEAKYNRDDLNVVDHFTYGICGDGDLMEGVSAEAASLAGHLGLGKLVVLYDSNDISLDGDLDKSFSENVQQRFEAYNWQVIRVEDGTDLDSISKAIEAAKAETTKPTLIEVKTVIGFGSPNKSGKSASHGAPLGDAEIKLTKASYVWDHEEFYVPDEVKDLFEERIEKRGADTEAAWTEKMEQYKAAHPELHAELVQAINNELPSNWEADLPTYDLTSKKATRQTSGEVLNAIAKNVPTIFGGSADLAGSNNTMLKGEADFDIDPSGRNIWFGVREFAMAAAVNGMALHGGVIPYGATFFVFSDYLRPAVRLAALMGIQSIFVLTHDSIAVGEDGPTHEPVEHLMSFRAMPNLTVYRPADGKETIAAWKTAVQSTNKPTLLVMTRQGLPELEGTTVEGAEKGGYVIAGDIEKADTILMGTGSEVHLLVEAQKELGETAAVVSLPSWELFEAQSAEYKESVLPKRITKRLAIEAGASLGWYKYVGTEGQVIGIDRFGASAPGDLLLKEYGMSVENVLNTVKQLG